MLPPARPHRLFNDSGANSYWFLLCAPAHFDQFVAAAGFPVAPYAEPRSATDADRRRLAEAAPRFGIRLLSSAAPQGEAHEPCASAPEVLDVLGARVEVLARLGDGDEDLVLLRETVEPGRSVSLHSHADPECFFMIGGVLDLYCGGNRVGWCKFRPDEAIYVSPNVRHAFRNSGAVPADLLIVTTVRMARFYATIGSPAIGPAARPPSPEKLAAFPKHVAAFGHWIGSANENAAVGLTTGA